MKRKNQIYFGIAGGCIAVGLVLCGIGLITGSYERLRRESSEKFHTWLGQAEWQTDDMLSRVSDAVWEDGDWVFDTNQNGAPVSFHFKKDQMLYSGECQVDFELRETVRKMKLEIEQTEILLEPSEDGTVYVESEGEGSFQIYEEEHTLRFKSCGVKNEDGEDSFVVRLYLPGERYWEEADLELNGVLLEGGTIEGREVDIESAGADVRLEEIRAQELSLEGAGVVLEVLRADCQELSVEMSAGSMVLGLSGGSDEYNYEVSAAAGEVTIDGENAQSLVGESQIRNGAARNVEIDCVAGSVELTFEE